MSRSVASERTRRQQTQAPGPAGKTGAASFRGRCQTRRAASRKKLSRIRARPTGGEAFQSRTELLLLAVIRRHTATAKKRNSQRPPRFCPSFHQANAPAFVPLHTLGFFQSRQASRIRFVFPKRRSSRRREHCQGGGSGRRGHYLDKRSGAIHSPAANTKQPRQHERSARPRIFARLRFTRSTLTVYTKKGATAPRAFTGTYPSSHCMAGSSGGFPASFSE